MSLKEIIQNNNFAFKKKFGQNFITDTNLLSSICQKADLSPNDTVIEIGVGGATLTRAISSCVKKVIGFEIDTTLMPVIAESLDGVKNAEVVFKDFMKVDLDKLETKINGNYSVVANLPYYITTPIIMRLIEDSKFCQKIVVMVQEEVAQRLCAKPNTAEYGSITASIDAVANAQIVARVSRDMFFPKPNVDSAVVRIDMNRQKYDINNMKALKTAIRLAFLSRRKTLANNLINGLKISRENAEKSLTDAGIDVGCRGETLSTIQFIALANSLEKFNFI